MNLACAMFSPLLLCFSRQTPARESSAEHGEGCEATLDFKHRSTATCWRLFCTNSMNFMHWRITLWNLDISGRCSLGLTMRTPNHLIIYPLQLPLTYKMLLWSGCIVRFKQTDLTLLSGFFANSLQLLLSRDVLWATWCNLWMTWIVTIGTFGIEAVISW